jgi:FAD/FMN-containing dehydrogenase
MENAMEDSMKDGMKGVEDSREDSMENAMEDSMKDGMKGVADSREDSMENAMEDSMKDGMKGIEDDVKDGMKDGEDGEDGVEDGMDDMAPYNVDWLGQYHGESRLALRPRHVDDVRAILARCHERGLAVTPQGGNTGLVGGGVPVFDEIVVSMARMNGILAFDEVSGVVTVEAGCVLQDLDDFLAARGHMVPLDLGSKGTCQIGGNVATNAGGLRYLRYGSLHGSVLGLEAVLPDGRVFDSLSTLRKDNTGYDLKQLFIGSEGTLGIITKVALSVPRRPTSARTMFLGLRDFDAVRTTYARAREQLAEVLSAFEVADAQSMDMLFEERGDHHREPLDRRYPFHLVIEVSGSHAAHDAEKMDAFLEALMGDGLVEDGVVAQDAEQSAALWALRENITVALNQAGYVYKYDFSLPLNSFYELVEETRARIEARFGGGDAGGESEIPLRVVGYGHVGDSNLHLNVCTPGRKRPTPEVTEVIEPFVYDFVREKRGSISAEHGLGQMKPAKIFHSKSEDSVGLMRQVKALFDPRGICNPYKMLPAAEGEEEGGGGGGGGR